MRVFENNERLGGASQFAHYAELDPLNSEYIRWQFPNDNSGNLYKGGGYADLKFLGDEPAPYAEKYFYAKQTNAWQNDYSDLTEFLRALSKADESALADRMDVDAWMRHLAVHDLLGNEETSLVTGDKGGKVVLQFSENLDKWTDMQTYTNESGQLWMNINRGADAGRLFFRVRAE